MDLLLVPGFVSHLEHIWKEPQLSAFLHRLAGFSRLILFDKRGVGLSDRVGYAPTLDHTVQDIRAVMQAAGSQKVVLFGVSEGGPASLRFCEAYPQEAHRLILYGAMAKGTRSRNYTFALTASQYDRWLDLMLQSWGGPSGIEYFAPSRADDSGLRQWWAELLRLASSPGGVRLVLEVLRDIDVRPILAHIQQPTLVLHRRDDKAIPAGAGKYLAAGVPHAHFVELPGNDHWWWVGDTEAILDQVEQYCRAAQGQQTPMLQKSEGFRAKATRAPP